MELKFGDCLYSLRSVASNSVDSIVTDPPYGLSFMGKKWDYDVPSIEIWKEALRVLKPGGHLLSFGGTRTYHRLVVNIEDAGFEIRDCIQWLYGSGFPKSTDVSKRIDKEAGAEREVIGRDISRQNVKSSMLGKADKNSPNYDGTTFGVGAFDITAPATDSAKQWQGWGTALKPANEIICMAVKPLTDKDLLSNLVRECQSKLFVLIAKNHLTSSQSEKTPPSIVQWIAGRHTLTQEDLSELTAMLQLKSKTNSNLSTELSWLDTLDEVFRHASTFTTETESSLITDLKILKSYLLKTMQANMHQNDGLGSQWNVSLVKSLLNALELKLNYILTPSAQDSVTSKATALSPNNEPICVARKPLEKGLTVAENVLKYGTGAINIDASRIEGKLEGDPNRFNKTKGGEFVAKFDTAPVVRAEGRWPANIILDEEAAAALDEQSGDKIRGASFERTGSQPEFSFTVGKEHKSQKGHTVHANSYGGASRFFYVTKASKKDRGEGNNHPTVKPIKLMEYLIKLVTPPSGTVLDPFMGSGSTGVAAKNLGFDFIGCEMNPEYFNISQKRMET